MFDPWAPSDHPAEDSHPRTSPLGIAEENENGDDGNDLGDGLVLAIALGCQHQIFGRRQKPQARDRELTSNDNHHHPSLHLAQFHKGDERGASQDLVRQRIHENTKVGDQVLFPGDSTVQKIRNASDAKKNESNRLIPPKRGEDHDQKEGREDESRESELIRQRHRIGTLTEFWLVSRLLPHKRNLEPQGGLRDLQECGATFAEDGIG